MASIDNQGVLVVHKHDPGALPRSLIIVPVDIIPGIIIAIHLKFKHASKHQLKLLFNRYFFGIKSDGVVNQVVDQCSLCNALKEVPKEVFKQSSSVSPSSPGSIFFADNLRRNRQKICVVRDVHSTYTTASIVDDETSNSLRNALLLNTSFLRNPQATIRIDAATGFQALHNDLSFQQHGITLDFGHIKNKNSNSVIDKGIQELESELLKHDTSGAPVTTLQLQTVLTTLNTRIRNRGLSAREILFQRDQQTNEQLSICDKELSSKQQDIRTQNHPLSAISKAPRGKLALLNPAVSIGKLVFIKHERNKNHPRDRYIVTKINGDNALVQKLCSQFMSRQYTVPLNKLYPASNPTTNRDYDSRRYDSNSSSDDDSSVVSLEVPSGDPMQNVDEDKEEVDVMIDGQHPDVNDINDNVLPPRARRRPRWIRDGQFEMG